MPARIRCPRSTIDHYGCGRPYLQAGSHTARGDNERKTDHDSDFDRVAPSLRRGSLLLDIEAASHGADHFPERLAGRPIEADVTQAEAAAVRRIAGKLVWRRALHALVRPFGGVMLLIRLGQRMAVIVAL